MTSDFVLPEDPSSICTTGLQPYILTGIFLQILRHHFSSAESIVQPNLSDYTWSPDTKDSKILIETIYRWRPENIDQRPALVVKRMPLKKQTTTIGNKVHGTVEKDGYAEDIMTIAFTGAHVVYCIGRTGTEAESLAAEVAYEFLEFSQVIRRQFNMLRFEMEEIGQLVRLEESHDHFAVPITLTYAYNHNWSVLRESPFWMSTGLTTES